MIKILTKNGPLATTLNNSNSTKTNTTSKNTTASSTSLNFNVNTF